MCKRTVYGHGHRGDAKNFDHATERTAEGWSTRNHLSGKTGMRRLVWKRYWTMESIPHRHTGTGTISLLGPTEMDGGPMPQEKHGTACMDKPIQSKNQNHHHPQHQPYINTQTRKRIQLWRTDNTQSRIRWKQGIYMPCDRWYPQKIRCRRTAYRWLFLPIPCSGTDHTRHKIFWSKFQRHYQYQWLEEV